MNHYPAWKNVLIFGTIFVLAFYALPNVYGEHPVVQISHESGTMKSLPDKEIRDMLDNAGISYSDLKLSRNPGQGLFVVFERFADQLKARELIDQRLSNDYIVALNTITAMPDWLHRFRAKPINLGLDLKGGVYFLLAVDTDAIYKRGMEGYRDTLRADLRTARIAYKRISVAGRKLIVEIDNPEDRASVRNFIERQFSGVLDLDSDAIDKRRRLEWLMSEAEAKRLVGFAVQQNIVTLRRRIDELGVAEPMVARQGFDRIAIQLPGVQDTAQAKEILGATATLEFRFVFEGGSASRAHATGRPPPGSRLYYERDGTPVLLSRNLMLSGEHIVDAASGIDSRTSLPNVNIALDSRGSRIFSKATAKAVGRLMGVVYIENKTESFRNQLGEIQRRTITEEEVINVARIQEPLGQRFQITGLDSTSEARKLALLLRAGALAAPLEIAEERTVGPSLGQDNINQGTYSILLAFLLVILFMGFYYKVFGLFADFALLVNIILIISFMSMIPGASLTLPGIVGIVLTVGMAVDANVLIFERIREQLRKGKTVQLAIDTGYRQALSTIADANITTLITALVLFVFGSGPIRGFAVTLSIGILCSMFTSIIGTRALVNGLYGGKKVKSLAI